MNAMTRACCAAMLLGVAAMSVAHAAVVYDESTDGDLSDDRGAPTQIVLNAGANDLIGTSGFDGTTSFRDYATFVVPVGATLTSIKAIEGMEPAVAVSFIGIQAGPAITVDPNLPNPALLLGWQHVGSVGAGQTLDILTGVTPLGPGTYSLWIQDFDFGDSAYAFRFELSAPVPEPSTWMTLALGGVFLLGSLSRKYPSIAG